MSERAQWVLFSLACWLVLLLAISGCGLRQFGAEGSFAVLAEEPSIARPGADLAARPGVDLAALQREIDRTKLRNTCLLFPVKAQLQCVLLHL